MRWELFLKVQITKIRPCKVMRMVQEDKNLMATHTLELKMERRTKMMTKRAQKMVLVRLVASRVVRARGLILTTLDASHVLEHLILSPGLVKTVLESSIKITKVVFHVQTDNNRMTRVCVVLVLAATSTRATNSIAITWIGVSHPSHW